MTITYVGAGTAATGNNTSVVPGAPAGVATGDLVLIHASIRNTGTGTPDTPPGWTRVSGQGSEALFGRFWQTGDTMPTVTFTGGVANADTIGRAIALRGVAPDALTASTSAAQANASGQNIAYPALNVPGGSHAVVLAVWKQDDATTYSTPATMTAVGLTSTTTGDDASQALFYVIQTSEADITAGSITVTGGAAAVSSALAVALHPAAAISAVAQGSWPPSVLVSLTGLVTGLDTVAIYRSVGGEETLLRTGQSAGAVTDPSYLVLDAELPFGVPVSYVAVVNSSARYETAPVTYTLPGGKVALTDAISGLALECVILAWDSLTYDRNATVFKVGARNIVVAGDLGQWEADITIYLSSDTANDAMAELLEASTESVLQLRQPGGYAGVDAYVSVTSAKKTRFSQDGSDPRRTWVLHAVQVDGWAPTLEASGASLQDIYDFYGVSGTLADLAGDYATLLDIAQVDWP